MLASIFALFNVAALFFLNWRLGLVAAGLMTVFPLATAAAMRPLWNCQRGISALRGEIAGLLFVLLGGISRIRVAGAERAGLCPVGSALSRAAQTEPSLSDDLGPAGALWRRLAARGADGHTRLRGLWLGVPERRRVPRVQFLADAGSRRGGRPLARGPSL